MTRPEARGIVGLLVVLASAAWACGPDFPSPILNGRKLALYSTPYRSFAIEASKLAPASADQLTAHEQAADSTSQVEANGLTATDADRIRRMRAQPTGDTAYKVGAGLPDSVRLYTAGAVDYRLASPVPDDSGSRLDQGRITAASTRFTAVLALPPAAAAPRATWAAYMLGRAHLLEGEKAAAIVDFQRTRELALGGAPDPLGLAVASFGEEARLALTAGHTAEAIRLYAEQAARGSGSGRDSLRIVARQLLDDPDALVAELSHPEVRRLLVSHTIEVLQSNGNAEATPDVPAGSADPQDTASRHQRASIRVLLGAVEHANLAEVDGLDEVAALAYAAGRFDLAERYAKKAPTALGQALLAKLALRRGDRDAAAKGYAGVVAQLKKLTPTAPDRLDGLTTNALVAENGVLQVARGDYVSALRTLLDAGGDYWFDAAYVAERILTTQELQTVVDSLPQRTRAIGDNADPQSDLPETALSLRARGVAVRLLLARRLMRDGNYAAAYAYFGGETTADDDKAPLASLARRYATALDGSQRRWTAVGRAEAAFEAARLARRYGMELLGFELEPDMAVFNGSLGPGFGPNLANGDAYAGPDEVSRVGRSAKADLQRFHYRATAQGLAGQAADLLPARSQAFVAVLCIAAGWTRDGPTVDHERELQVYDRYRRYGPHVSWATNFGRHCQQPEFGRAAVQARSEQWTKLRHCLHPYKPVLIGVGVLAAMALAWLALKRFRRTDVEPT